MICHQCMLRLTRPSLKSASRARGLVNSARRTQKTITSDKVTSVPRKGTPESHQPSAATSTSAAQPFSTPLTPSPANAGVKAGKKATAPSPLVLSSVPAGTPLKGLNFLKNGSDPVALPDEEYPSWLWTLLTPKKKKGAMSSDLEEGIYCTYRASLCCWSTADRMTSLSSRFCNQKEKSREGAKEEGPFESRESSSEGAATRAEYRLSVRGWDIARRVGRRCSSRRLDKGDEAKEEKRHKGVQLLESYGLIW
jgi:hypothetical protein